MTRTPKEPRRAASYELAIVADPLALAEAAAVRVRHLLVEAVRARGRATLALSGGSTPKRLYELLAHADDVPWQHVELFFGDERHVPPLHPDSNAGMARAALGPVATTSVVHAIHGELADANQAAEDYERVLRDAFSGQAAPRFDLVLLGLGDDGHTASLFPGGSAVRERDRWVVSVSVPKLATSRITLTPPVLDAAAQVMFLVAGAAKAHALSALLADEGSIDEVPARVVTPTPRGRVVILADRAAANGIGATR